MLAGIPAPSRRLSVTQLILGWLPVLLSSNHFFVHFSSWRSSFPHACSAFFSFPFNPFFLLTLHIVFSLWGTLSLKTPSFRTFFSLVIPLSICSRLVQREQGLSMKIFDYTPRLLTLLTSLTPSPPALKPFFLLCFTHPNPHNPQTPSTLFVSTCLHSANEWCQLRWKLNEQCILQREITKTCLHLIMVVCWISRLWITSCTCF